jgi:hypothetical protein
MTMIDHEHGKKNIEHDESTFMYPKLIFGIAKLTKHYKAKVQTATQCTFGMHPAISTLNWTQTGWDSNPPFWELHYICFANPR